MSRYARKKDVNHNAIADALEAAGCSVLDLSRLAHGTPDALVWSPRLHAYCLVEIKNPEGRNRMEPRQVEFLKRWRGPVVVVESVDEALRLFAGVQEHGPLCATWSASFPGLPCTCGAAK